MIETRPQNVVAAGVDPGNPEGWHVSAAAVSARGYNFVVGSRNCRRHQLLHMG
jgi:hypothetical protein